jgi:hypothetical protein
MVHSTGSLIAPGSQPLLAFSPDGASLAVGSLTAQVLSTDAVAVAAAGGQPGTISLYQVAAAAPASSSSSGAGGAALSALLPPLLLEQRPGGAQLPELRLWHQWSLSSAPAGLLVLPGSSGLRLLEGVQLRPSQVCMPLVIYRFVCFVCTD